MAQGNDSGSTRAAAPRTVAAVVAVVGIAVGFFLLKSRSEHGAAPASSSSEEPREEAAPADLPVLHSVIRPSEMPPRLSARADTPKPAPLPPIDLFTPDTPEVLKKTHEVALSGALLPLERMKELYQLGKDRLGDARPHLVMAEDAMNRGWQDFAIDHYRRAAREDSRARQDPRMLKDLVAIAGGKRAGGKASEAIVSIYGPAAIVSVEEALAQAGDKGDQDRVQQLAALSRQLADLPR